MILTGQAIQQAFEKGDIIIDPFTPSHLNPNSYNFRLFGSLLRVSKLEETTQTVEQIDLPDEGFILQPGTLYLGATLEILGSTKYAMTLLGRSSLGRLGLFLNITADLGHVGAVSRWTLELSVVQPLKVYPRMRVGQIAFWSQAGITDGYNGRYHKDSGPIPSRFFEPNLTLEARDTKNDLDRLSN